MEKAKWYPVMAYSTDLREKIVRAYDDGLGSQRKIAELLGVSRSFVKKLLHRRRTTGEITALPHGGGRTALCQDKEHELVRRLISNQPDATLDELCEALEIKQGKNEVTVAEGNLRERKFYTDGRPSRREDERGNLIRMRARWQAEKLVVETRLADGGRFTESYELAPGGRQLFVTVTSQDRRLKQPLVIRRVYDAVADEAN